jgi:hypothetical protein
MKSAQALVNVGYHNDFDDEVTFFENRVVVEG